MAYDINNRINELYLGFQLVGWPKYKKSRPWNEVGGIDKLC